MTFLVDLTYALLNKLINLFGLRKIKIIKIDTKCAKFQQSVISDRNISGI